MKPIVTAALALVASMSYAVILIPLEYEVIAETGTSPSGTESGPLFNQNLGGLPHSDYVEDILYSDVHFRRDNTISDAGARLKFIMYGNDDDLSGANSLAYRFAASGSGSVRLHLRVFTTISAFRVPTTYSAHLRDLTTGDYLWQTSNTPAFGTTSVDLEDSHVYEILGVHEGTNIGNPGKSFSGTTDIEVGQPVPEPGTLLTVALGALVLRRRYHRTKE